MAFNVDHLDEIDQPSKLNLTFILRVPRAGRMVAERIYKTQRTDELTFFTSQSSPPVVFELMINRKQNFSIRRVYRVPFADESRYVGLDRIAVSERFILHLVYDFFEASPVIRSFYRNETNFSIGHGLIFLRQYGRQISGMEFLDFYRSDRVFIRDNQRWDLFKLQDTELIIDTHTQPQFFRSWINNTFHVTLFGGPFTSDHHVIIQFKMICLDKNRRDTIFIPHNRPAIAQYPYARRFFIFDLQGYFVGPMKNLTLELTRSTKYQNITLPIVMNSVNEETYLGILPIEER